MSSRVVFSRGYRILPGSLDGSQSRTYILFMQDNRSRSKQSFGRFSAEFPLPFSFSSSVNHLLPASLVYPMSQRVTMATGHIPCFEMVDMRGAYTQFSPSLIPLPCFPDAPRDPSIPCDNLINARLIASVFNFNIVRAGCSSCNYPLSF